MLVHSLNPNCYLPPSSPDNQDLKLGGEHRIAGLAWKWAWLRKKHLLLLNALDRHSVASGFLRGHIRVAKLAMAQQLPQRVLRLEVFFVPKVRPLAQGEGVAFVVPQVVCVEPRLLTLRRGSGCSFCRLDGLLSFLAITLYSRFCLLDMNLRYIPILFLLSFPRCWSFGATTSHPMPPAVPPFSGFMLLSFSYVTCHLLTFHLEFTPQENARGWQFPLPQTPDRRIYYAQTHLWKLWIPELSAWGDNASLSTNKPPRTAFPDVLFVK